MMVRRVNVSYVLTDGMTLTGFRQEIGDIFGQKRTSYGLSPGLDFAFGGVSRNYIDRALERNWLINDINRIDPLL